MTGHLGFFPIEGDRIAAYNIERGTLLWLVPSKVLFQPAGGDGLLFVVEPESLVAFRQDTGSVAWRVPFTEPLSVPLTWDNGWLIAAATSGTVLAFRASDGVLIWRREIEGGLRARPSLTADRVYVPASGRIVALRVENGSILWERRIGGEPNEILALDDRLYVGSTDNYLYSILTRTGEIGWRWSTGGDVIGVPVVDRRSVYFVSFDNVLRALNRKSGVQRWKRALTLRPTRGPLRADDAIVVSGLSRNALAFSTRDGSPAGELAGEGELAAMPYLVDEGTTPTLVLVTRDFTNGTVVRALTRSYEPSTGRIAPLPNPVMPPRPPGAAPSTGEPPAAETPADEPSAPPEPSSSEAAPPPSSPPDR